VEFPNDEMTRYNLEKYHRRSIRLKGYDYTQEGTYFITICTHGRESLLGEIVNGEMLLNAYGRVVQTCWKEIPIHFKNLELDVFGLMPNHIHGIIATNVGARHAVPLHSVESFGNPVTGSIPTIIRSFKSAITNKINKIRQTPNAPVWQRNYYEHVIRNEESLNRIREYIFNNPLNWVRDPENPRAISRSPLPSRKKQKPWEV